MFRRYKALGHQTQSTYTMQQMRMPLVIALCLSPLALMSSSSTGFNSKVPLLDLWQVSALIEWAINALVNPLP